MEVEHVIAILNKGAKKLAPILFKRKYDYVDRQRFLALYIEGEYCCYVVAQAKLNPVGIDILAAYKDMFLLEKIQFTKNQRINNKDMINVDNLYYICDFRIDELYYSKDLLAKVLDKVARIEFLNIKTDESLYVYRTETQEYVNIQITKTEFDTLMLELNMHVIINLIDNYIVIERVNYSTLLNILKIRKNDVIIKNSVQNS